LGYRLDLDQAVGFESGAGLDEIDDQAAEAKARRQLDRAVELDAFRLNAACRKMAAGDFGILRCNANMARTPDIVVRDPVLGRRDH